MEERERSAEDLLKEMRDLGEKINSEDDVAFEKVKREWAEYCPGVDEVLEEYARKINGKVEAWVHDSPSRVLT